MNINASSSTILLAAVAACSSTALLAQNYTIYGTGCGQPVLIANDSPLIPGMRTRMLLDRAPSNQGALIVLGFQQTAIPVLGCTLLTQPAASLFFVTDSTGHAQHVMDMPPQPNFVGLAIYNQWLFLDASLPQGIGFSQGGCGIIVNPQFTVGAFSPSSGGIGTVITATMGGLGTNDPDNLCMRVSLQGVPGSSLVRVTSIVPLGGGLATVTGTLVTANPSPVIQGQMGAMRGTGDTVPVPAGVKLSAPAEGWGWNGAGLPQAGGMGGPFNAMPSPQTPIPFSMVGNSILATLPAGPYLVNQQITLDVHWDVACPGLPPVHYDHFLGTMTVLANMTAIECRNEVAAKIATVFNNLWPGKVAVNVPVPGGAQIVITMVDPTCTITGGGGSLYVQ